jgi:RNA polymerase sigma factor (sigma-70 family)
MNEPHDPSANASRIEGIPTRASLRQAAHQGNATTAGPARNALVMRYRKAIRAYLGRLLQNDADADEVAQEVVVKMLKGEFANVSSARGRFRDYLKVTVRNAALHHIRQRGKSRSVTLAPELLGEQGGPASEENWLADWRRTLLESARQRLRDYQAQHQGNVYATLLDLIGEFPEEDSEQLARCVYQATGQAYRADAVRKQISRARRKLAEFLLEEVKRTLEAPTPAEVEEELIEVGLLVFIKDFLPAEQ